MDLSGLQLELFIRSKKGRIMAEVTQYTFSFKELAEALVKKQDLHEGIWGIAIKFGLQATNLGPNPENLQPSAIVPIVEIGIHKQEEMTSLSVDAAIVNPPPTRKRKNSSKKTKTSSKQS